jgi:hypothetical protein
MEDLAVLLIGCSPPLQYKKAGVEGICLNARFSFYIEKSSSKFGSGSSFFQALICHNGDSSLPWISCYFIFLGNAASSWGSFVKP